MSQPSPDGQSRVELSQDLRAALQRAHGYAQHQAHRFITVEHVLLALNEDPDASLILEACGVDQAQLHADISGHLGHLESRFDPGEANQPVMDPEASRIINSAVAASQKSGRPVVNGAIVLAAIIGDGRSAAANSLRSQGLTFEAAIRALQQAASSAADQPRTRPEPETPATNDGPPPEIQETEDQPDVGQDPAPAPAVAAPRVNGHAPSPAASGATEDLLADARKRVEALQKAQIDERARRHEPPVEVKPEAVVPTRPGEPGEDEADTATAAAPPPQPRMPQEQPVVQPSQADRPAPDPARRLQERLREQAAHAGEGRRGPFDDDEEAPSPRIKPPLGPPPRQPQSLPHQAGPARPMPSPQPPAPHPRGPAPHHPASSRPYPGPVHGPQPAPPGDHGNRPGAGSQPSHRPEFADPRLGPFAVGGDAGGAALPPNMAPPQRPPHPQPNSGRAYDPARGAVQPGHPGGPAPTRPELDEAPDRRREEPSTGRQLVPGLDTGQLHENIPRKMRAWVPCRVEIRIARAEIANVGAGMVGPAPSVRHDIRITKAMSVRLRAPEGGFFIESGSPETQWIESQIGLLNDEFASWRWTVTPTRRGRARLQLIVSARTVGPDGLAAESAMPDQVIDVSVAVNYFRLLKTWGGWIAAAVVGGLLAKFGEGVLALGLSLLG